MKVVTYFGQTDRTCGLTVKVRDAQPRNYRHLATVCGDTPQKNVYSLTNVVLYLLKVKSFEEPFFFSLNFTSVPLNETSEQLEIRYTSLTSGRGGLSLHDATLWARTNPRWWSLLQILRGMVGDFVGDCVYNLSSARRTAANFKHGAKAEGFLVVDSVGTNRSDCRKTHVHWNAGYGSFFYRTCIEIAGSGCDGSMAFYLPPRGEDAPELPDYPDPTCAVVSVNGYVHFIGRLHRYRFHVICEVDIDSERVRHDLKPATIVVLQQVSTSWRRPQLVQCPLHHTTLLFLACDPHTACWGTGYGSVYTCRLPVTPLPPSFTCVNQQERVPYTLVCDYRTDCSDGSDEEFCVFPPCNTRTDVLTYEQRCDGRPGCVNGADEEKCSMTPTGGWLSPDTSPPPAIVNHDSKEKLRVTPWNVSEDADQMNLLPNLKVLTLAGNPLTSFFSGDSILNLSLPALQDLDVSRVFLPELDAAIFSVFPELQVLNLSDCGVERLLGDGFHKIQLLQRLDLQGCPMRLFSPGVFKGLVHLEHVRTARQRRPQKNGRGKIDVRLPDGGTIQISIPTGTVSTNYKAEAEALQTAVTTLEETRDNTHNQVVIFSDALSVLQALLNPRNKGLSTIAASLIRLQQSTEHTVIQWIAQCLRLGSTQIVGYACPDENCSVLANGMCVTGACECRPGFFDPGDKTCKQ
ncbi:hypothetical protein BaRGS_00039657, partial [Batillaria attramentaria]